MHRSIIVRLVVTGLLLSVVARGLSPTVSRAQAVSDPTSDRTINVVVTDRNGGPQSGAQVTVYALDQVPQVGIAQGITDPYGRVAFFLANEAARSAVNATTDPVAGSAIRSVNYRVLAALPVTTNEVTGLPTVGITSTISTLFFVDHSLLRQQEPDEARYEDLLETYEGTGVEDITLQLVPIDLDRTSGLIVGGENVTARNPKLDPSTDRRGATTFNLDAPSRVLDSPSHYVVGDRLWVDEDADGRQESGEPGIAGITVRLHRTTPASPPQVDITDAAGYYSFDAAPNAYYYLEFVLPSGAAFTARDVSGVPEHLDSDADPVTGHTVSFFVSSANPTAHAVQWDAGILPGAAHTGDQWYPTGSFQDVFLGTDYVRLPLDDLQSLPAVEENKSVCLRYVVTANAVMSLEGRLNLVFVELQGKYTIFSQYLHGTSWVCQGSQQVILVKALDFYRVMQEFSPGFWVPVISIRDSRVGDTFEFAPVPPERSAANGSGDWRAIENHPEGRKWFDPWGPADGVGAWGRTRGYTTGARVEFPVADLVGKLDATWETTDGTRVEMTVDWSEASQKYDRIYRYGIEPQADSSTAVSLNEKYIHLYTGFREKSEGRPLDCSIPVSLDGLWNNLDEHHESPVGGGRTEPYVMLGAGPARIRLMNDPAGAATVALRASPMFTYKPKFLAPGRYEMWADAMDLAYYWNVESGATAVTVGSIDFEPVAEGSEAKDCRVPQLPYLPYQYAYTPEGFIGRWTDIWHLQTCSALCPRPSGESVVHTYRIKSIQSKHDTVDVSSIGDVTTIRLNLVGHLHNPFRQFSKAQSFPVQDLLAAGMCR
jgi:hypothetical protein